MSLVIDFTEPASEVVPTDSWYDSVRPDVSIIILNFNKSDLTRECLRHLWKKTSGRHYEIIVVDNGSEGAEFIKLSHFPGDFRLVRVPVNRYFGEGNNLGVEASRGRYLVFLNNDAFVTENWLLPLISALEDCPTAGGAGPTFLYPDGRLQEAGAFIDREGRAIQRGKFTSPAYDALDRADVVDYCSAACFATTRELFDRVSGFDASFEPAYYEDVDLAFKITSLGYQIYHCPGSVVHHIENGTAATFGARLGLNNVVEINRQKFLSRWGSYLSGRETGAEASIQPIPAARARARPADRASDPVAVFYTMYDLVPGGGERYLLTAATAAARTHQVFIATYWPYSQYRLDYLARELSLDLSGIRLITVAELHRVGKIDFFAQMANFSIPSVPGPGRRNVLICQFPFPLVQETEASYWENIRSYDSIIVYSDFVAGALGKILNPFQFPADINVLHPPVPMNATVRATVDVASPPIILSIGRFFAGGHNKRHDVMIDAARRLQQAGIEVELHLVGTLHPGSDHMRHYGELCRRAEGLNVHFHPSAPPAVVADLLARATFYWHATGFGIDQRLDPEQCEHFGISVIEAMSAGCIPFVVSNGGPASLVHENSDGFQYATLDELVAKTIALIRNPARIAPLRENAIANAQQFAENVFIERWREIIQR